MSGMYRSLAIKEVQRRIDYLTTRIAQHQLSERARHAELTERAALRWLLARELKRGEMTTEEARQLAAMAP